MLVYLELLKDFTVEFVMIGTCPILVKQAQFIMLRNYLVKPLQNLSQWKTFFRRSDALAYFL